MRGKAVSIEMKIELKREIREVDDFQVQGPRSKQCTDSGDQIIPQENNYKTCFLMRTLFVSQLVTLIDGYSEPCCMVYKNALRGTSLERQ